MAFVQDINTEQVRPWNAPRPKTAIPVTFPKPFNAPPGLLFGLNYLDVANSGNLRVKTYASDVKNTGFVANAESWSDTTLYRAGASVLEIAPGDPDFQYGQFDTEEDHPWNVPQLLTSRRVNFARPFASPPKVITFLNTLDMHKSYNWRVKTYVTDIDAKGFTIHVDTWFNSILYWALVGWVAYPSDRAFTASGSDNVMDVRPWDKPTKTTEKAITFGGIPFPTAPSVFFGLNFLDIDRNANLRIQATVDKVTTTGLTWHLDTWADTTLYSAGLSYLSFLDNSQGGGGNPPAEPEPLPS